MMLESENVALLTAALGRTGMSESGLWIHCGPNGPNAINFSDCGFPKMPGMKVLTRTIVAFGNNQQ